MASEYNDSVSIHVKKRHTSKVFRLCEEFGTSPIKTFNMALDIGLAKIDEDLRHKPTSRYFKKLSVGGAE